MIHDHGFYDERTEKNGQQLRLSSFEIRLIGTGCSHSAEKQGVGFTILQRIWTSALKP